VPAAETPDGAVMAQKFGASVKPTPWASSRWARSHHDDECGQQAAKNQQNLLKGIGKLLKNFHGDAGGNVDFRQERQARAGELRAGSPFG